MDLQQGTIGRGRAGPGATTTAEPRSLDGKVGIVTGASRGIGAAVARALASAGAHLSLAARDVSALEGLTRELGHRGRHAVAVPTDVTDPDAVERLVADTVETFGRLDLAVNNAGGGFTGKTGVADVTVEDFRAHLELNLTSVFVSMRHEIAAMRASGGGVIVNISSGSGSRAAAGMGPYVVAKHGLHGLTRVAALDYAERGIRINAVAPGPVLAGPLADADPQFRKLAAQSVPMARIGDCDEVADTVAWLCSDHASFITGATIPLDGGQVAGTPRG